MIENTSHASLRPEAISSASSSPVILTPTSEASGLSNKPPLRQPSPLHIGHYGSRSQPPGSKGSSSSGQTAVEAQALLRADDSGDEGEDTMLERPPAHRSLDSRSGVPLLKDERGRPSYDSPNGSARPALQARRSTFSSRSPDFEASSATRRKYMYAAFFLPLSLISFVVQTMTASYIQKELGWNKAYCMLYLTHGSWALLWPVQLLILRLQKRKMPWNAFWKRHTYLLRSTAQMVETRELHITPKNAKRSPIPYMVRTTALVTTALTIAGGSWYVAIDYTTETDLTAIYNCSAFFAYAFSIPLLGDKFRFDKVFAVVVAIAGVLIIAYGDKKEGGGETPSKDDGASNRALGNIVIGIGSLLYGLYEVLYKRFACPPEGTSAGRGMIFANTFGSLVGCFTLFVLWIPLPILHFTGLERFELPHGQAAWLLAISIIANATFSGSFLILISLTSPVLSSVAALLTIFLVAIVSGLLPYGQPLSAAAMLGGLIIIAAFLLLSWSTFREMNEERRKRVEDEGLVSEDEN